MKINFQKIVAVTVACAMAVIACCVTVYAESSLHKDFTTKTGLVIYNVFKGRMTPEEAALELEYLNLVYESQLSDSDMEQIKSILPQITNGLAQADVGILQALIDMLNLLGIDVSGYWDDYANDNGILGDSTIDTKGYGAVLVTRSTGCNFTTWYYGDYGVILDNGRYYIKYYRKITLQDDGTVTDTYEPDPYGTITVSSYERLIGDWRYEDGTQSEEAEEPETLPPELNNQDENTIREFLEDLFENLPFIYPDLSSIEGLLSAILAKLDTLDSDNDNTLLSQILVAIQSLEASGGDNTDLLNCLEEIRNSLVFEDGDNVSTLALQLQTLVDGQLTIDDFVIDEQAYINNDEVLKLRLQDKFSFATDLKRLVDTAITSYSNTNENPIISFSIYEHDYSIDFSAFDDNIDVIRFMLVAFIYLTYAWRTYRKIPSYINGGDNE